MPLFRQAYSAQDVRERARWLGQQGYLPTGRAPPGSLTGPASKTSRAAPGSLAGPARTTCYDAKTDSRSGTTAGISAPDSLPWPVAARLLSCFLLGLAYLFLLIACFSLLILLLGHVLFLLDAHLPRQPLLHVFGRLGSCLRTRLQIRRQPFPWVEPVFLQRRHDAKHHHCQLPRPFT